jgi:hypothetical protein
MQDMHGLNKNKKETIHNQEAYLRNSVRQLQVLNEIEVLS